MLQSPSLAGGSLGGGGVFTSRADENQASGQPRASANHGVNGTTSSMQHSGQPPFHFNNTPFSQPLPSAAPLQPQQQPAVTHTASPQSSSSPQIKYPMAAPPLPGTPASQHGGSNSISAPSPKSPQSPGVQSREQQRIALLLEINNELFQEIDKMQTEGQGGAVDQQQLQHLRNEGLPEKMATEQFIQTMRRVQANLAYLMPKASADPSKAPPGPAHMTPPPHMASLMPLYERLRTLFPEWPGLDARMANSSPQPNGPNVQQAVAANGSTAPQQQQQQQPQY